MSEPTPLDRATLWLLLALAALWLVVHPALGRSMFFDGLIYSSIARNMAEGYGSPLRPAFSETLFPRFAEHPPLLMILQSLAFRALGDGFWVEKAFSLVLLIASGLVFAALWRRLAGTDKPLAALAPVPLVLALACGDSTAGFVQGLAWGFANNMLENGLVLFCSLAVYAVIRSRTADNTRQSLLWLGGGALAVACAVLVKGPVGLFPLASPALHALAFRPRGLIAALRDSLVLTAFTALILALCLIPPDGRAYAQTYLMQQVLVSLSGARGTAGGGTQALNALIYFNLIPVYVALGATALNLLVLHRSAAALRAFAASVPFRKALFLCLVGVSASAPILLSARVSTFYFNPSFPFYAAACASLAAPSILAIMAALPLAVKRLVAGSALAGLLLPVPAVLTHAVTPGPDAALLAAAERIAADTCKGQTSCRATIASCGSVGEDWALHAALQRHHRISLALTGGSTPAPSPFATVASPDCPIPVLSGQSTRPLPYNGYTLHLSARSL